jgi:hypothetical protein
LPPVVVVLALPLLPAVVVLADVVVLAVDLLFTADVPFTLCERCAAGGEERTVGSRFDSRGWLDAQLDIPALMAVAATSGTHHAFSRLEAAVAGGRIGDEPMPVKGRRIACIAP